MGARIVPQLWEDLPGERVELTARHGTTSRISAFLASAGLFELGSGAPYSSITGTLSTLTDTSGAYLSLPTSGAPQIAFPMFQTGAFEALTVVSVFRANKTSGPVVGAAAFVNGYQIPGIICDGSNLIGRIRLDYGAYLSLTGPVVDTTTIYKSVLHWQPLVGLTWWVNGVRYFDGDALHDVYDYPNKLVLEEGAACHMLACISGPRTAEELKSLHDNPWSIFSPRMLRARKSAGSTITTAILPAGVGAMGSGQTRAILPAGVGAMG